MSNNTWTKRQGLFQLPPRWRWRSFQVNREFTTGVLALELQRVDARVQASSKCLRGTGPLGGQRVGDVLPYNVCREGMNQSLTCCGGETWKIQPLSAAQAHLAQVHR